MEPRAPYSDEGPDRTGQDNALGWDVRQPESETRLAEGPAAAPDTGGVPAEKPPSWFLSDSEWQAVATALRLSDRQLQIAQYLFDGFDEASIAKALGLSHHTVHTHIHRLYRSLHIASRSELLVLVFLTHLSAARRLTSEVTPEVTRRRHGPRSLKPVLTRVVSTIRGHA
jgi:DNA-binding CsgD family transcriptional regulator